VIDFPAGLLRADTAGYSWRARLWSTDGGKDGGTDGESPLLLVHGIGASSRAWWRLGPALAATGRRVVAPDLPGHGGTRPWLDRHRFEQTAEDLAAFVAAIRLDPAEIDVVGHSWGAMVASRLPLAGLRPRRLVMLDPPAVTAAQIATMLEDPIERPFDDLDEAVRTVGGARPDWPYGDVFAKADGLTEAVEQAVRSVLTENGDWDAGLAGLAAPEAASVERWIVRGDPAAGGLTLDPGFAALAAVIGADHAVTIPGGEHSPFRLQPEATIAALLRALGGVIPARVGG
jgi:pimeloyl-ACP methyl ester carboxylesterase